MKDRLTAHYVYFDGQHGYEALGHDAYSQRPFIEITKKLALYEDTGYTPEEVKQLKTENIKLRAVVDAARVYVMEHDKIPNLRTLDEWIIIVAAIRNALAELDKEGER